MVRLKGRLVREVKVLSRRNALRACNREQLRRREARWGAAGGERPVRRITNSIRPGAFDEPAIEWRSLNSQGKAVALRGSVQKRPQGGVR